MICTRNHPLLNGGSLLFYFYFTRKILCKIRSPIRTPILSNARNDTKIGRVKQTDDSIRLCGYFLSISGDTPLLDRIILLDGAHPGFVLFKDPDNLLFGITLFLHAYLHVRGVFYREISHFKCHSLLGTAHPCKERFIVSCLLTDRQLHYSTFR